MPDRHNHINAAFVVSSMGLLPLSPAMPISSLLFTKLINISVQLALKHHENRESWLSRQQQ